MAIKARGQITITDVKDGTSVSILSTSVSYQLSNSGTTVPTGTWQENTVPQTTDAQPYLWTRTVVNYSNGKPTTSYSVSYKGKDGHTPTVSISSDGYWTIDGTKTNTKAQGNAGHTPTITISSDGYWVIDGTKTNTKAKGEDGYTPTVYTLAASSGNNDIGNDSHIAANNKNIYREANRGLTCYFLKGDTTPSSENTKSYDTYGNPSLCTSLANYLTTDAENYKNDVLVIIGFDAISVNSDLLNALKNYGYGGENLLYTVSHSRTSFVFIGQRNMSEGTAYYRMSKNQKIILNASVVNGVLMPIGHKGDKGDKGDKGIQGDKGQSILSADVVFATSSSQSNAPTFSASSPTTASSLISNANKDLFLWQATKTTYLDGTTQTTDFSGYACLGQIKSFASAIEQYAIGTYQQATGTWYDNTTTNIPKTQGLYLWTRTKLTYNSGEPSYSPSEGGKCVGYWGTDGDSATSYYLNPEAVIITERVNGITFNDDDTYTAKDYTYDIDHTIAIHKSVGNVDTIVKADAISITEGGALGLDKDKLQASFVSGTGYQLSSALTNSGLKSDTTINKIVVQFTIGTTKLLCPIYINRLGTVTAETIGDSTVTVRNKVVAEVQPSIDKAQTSANNAQSAADKANSAAQKAQDTANAAVTQTTFKAYQQATAQQFTQVYTKTQTKDIIRGEVTAKDIDLSDSKYDQDTFYLVFFKDVANIGTDKITMSIKNSFVQPLTKYGTHNLSDGKGNFYLNLIWSEFGNGWEARLDDNREILNYELNWSKGLVAGSIGQYIQDSIFFVYLRGGALYHVFCDHDAIIMLPTQSDLDNLPEQKGVPSLTLPLSKIVEPVMDKKDIYSKIEQKADRISLEVVENGLKKTGIDIESGKITSKADKFEWNDNSGNPIAKFDKDNGASFSGNVSAKTLSTNSGKSRIDEDGILHAEGADLNGSLTTIDGSSQTTISGGGMQVYDKGTLKTEHTGKTFANLDAILPGTDGSNITVPTTGTAVQTVTFVVGERSATKEITTFTPTVNGTLLLNVSRVSASILSSGSGNLRTGPRLMVEVLINNVTIWQSSYDYVRYPTDGSGISINKAFTINKYVTSGNSYTVSLRVTAYARTGEMSPPSIYATATCKIDSATISTNDYHSVFFGNGLLLSKSNKQYFAAMLDNDTMRVEARNGNNGMSLSSDGVRLLGPDGNWYKQPMTVAWLRISCNENPTIIASSVSGFSVSRISEGQFKLSFPSSFASLKLGNNGYLSLTTYTENQSRARSATYYNLTNTDVRVVNLQAGGVSYFGDIDIEIKLRP